MEDKGYFSGFVCIDPFLHRFPVSSEKNVQGSHLSHGKLYDLLLSIKEEERALPTSAVS